VPAYRALGQREQNLTWIVHADEIVRLGRSPPWEAWTGWVRDTRDTLLARCDGLDAEARGIARALVGGDMSALDPEVSQRFTRTGLRHLLSVSGMHVNMLASLALLPLLGSRRMRGRFGWAAAVALGVALAVYTGLIGSQAPVRRAAVALVLVVAAPIAARLGARSRRVDTLSLWSLGLVVESALDVRALFSASLQLSYLATLGLILATRPASALLRAWLGRGRLRTLGATTL